MAPGKAERPGKTKTGGGVVIIAGNCLSFKRSHEKIQRLESHTERGPGGRQEEEEASE